MNCTSIMLTNIKAVEAKLSSLSSLIAAIKFGSTIAG
eukprot:CAMPEP_0178443576 /NCGR_PEP_ID=MMETSP0689_2-20121128/38980_1 /TAXON_ID=160604 /ORGANISM="Amphidinium massartii, Strain CS-259" /LENGTH=36 /DNA_ID= /DNA_START= /DNA_END= /DNA_ORIENTATION=